MLKVIYGGSGTGKSTELRKRIKDTVNRGGSALLIVPDQFSFEAEKLIYKEVRPPYNGKYRVTTFSKEAQRILRRCGEAKPYADDVAKHIVMTLALDNAVSSGSLVYYNDQIHKKGFPKFALGTVGDMRGAGISPAQLRGVIADSTDMSPALTKKLSDISVIYSEYDRLLSQNFSDRLDDVRRAAELAGQTGEYDDCEIYVDKFDGFSGSQLAFLKSFLGTAPNLTLALTCDDPVSGEKCFETARSIIAQLAGDTRPDFTPLTRRLRTEPALRVIQARDKWQECEWICSEICELTNSGARFRDIAVICPDNGTALILDSTMKRYDIKGFVDIPEPLITKWFVRFPIYTLGALSFETEDLLRYIKSGFVRDPDGKVMNGLNGNSTAADTLELLSAKYDLRRRDWLKPFPAELDKTGELEDLRRCVIEPLQKLADDIGIHDTDSRADGALITEKLCSFMCSEMRMTSAVKSRCIIGRDADGKYRYDNKLLDELSEIWDDMITIFESANKALNGHAMTIAEYIEILSEAFSETKIAKPPQTLDEVTVGDPDRSRFTAVKHVFICGFTRGIMPPPSRVSEVFTASETEKLSELGIPVSDNRAERFAKELFTVYRCLGLPSERLYITYPLVSESGSFLEPSEALKDIKGFRPDMVEGADNFGADFYCRNIASAERYLSGIYSDPAHRAERRMLTDSGSQYTTKAFRDMLHSASGEKPDRERHKIDSSTASKLLLMSNYSPSALTELNKCKFSYFCKYGLGLPQEEDRSINAILTGNVIHYCLCRLLDDHLNNKQGFLALTPEDIAAHVSVSLNEYEKINYFSDFGGEARFSYLLKRLGVYAVKAAQKVQTELSVGRFYPTALEEKITFSFAGISFSGKCDRVDMATDENGAKHVRIIDYKRSHRDFPLTDIYNGNNLQTLLYLFGKCSPTSELIPAAAMYVPVGGIEFGKTGDTAAAPDLKSVTRKYYTDHKPSGVILVNDPAANTETETPGKLDKDLINTTFSSDFGKADYYPLTELTYTSYEHMKAYVGSYLNNLISEAGHGIAGACPKEGACTYCTYKLFCGHK